MPETITDETKQRILEVAAGLLNEGPVRTLRVQEIAERSGVAPSTIYKAYANKYELFVYAAESVFANQVERIRGSVDESDPPLEIVRDALAQFFELVRDHPHAASYLFAAVPFAYRDEIEGDELDRIAALGRFVRDRFRHRLAAAVEAGELSGDPELLADHCVVAAFGYVGIAATGISLFEPDDFADTTIDCLRVIGSSHGA